MNYHYNGSVGMLFVDERCMRVLFEDFEVRGAVTLAASSTGARQRFSTTTSTTSGSWERTGRFEGWGGGGSFGRTSGGEGRNSRTLPSRVFEVLPFLVWLDV